MIENGRLDRDSWEIGIFIPESNGRASRFFGAPKDFLSFPLPRLGAVFVFGVERKLCQTTPGGTASLIVIIFPPKAYIEPEFSV